ncbi:ABC transporter ATP-binding protein [Vibrio methylphosphonaticus]|uniref:ABC transporter ATP-binding protein n=1 Tax=Vibrio methylphosphonaticus TaxID=2946866 RepID=UPI00202A8356|nr:ABC transporter ATP-binding protein [Vibrio methylphosphonaticus]MCL9776261.1 ABC transporter ATP-binding protein [Vibrio methylphosphonaticus]
MMKFDGISKQYSLGQSQITALDGVSGEIAQGELVALCGPSGSGKSTLLNILGMLDTHYDGEVMFGGEVLSKNPKALIPFRRQNLGFIFQRFNLIPVMSALENVSYPLMLNGLTTKEQHSQSLAMLEKVGLADWAHHRPDAMSGGQQQRVAIARALVHKPSLVIADEPTASLDSASASQVIELMKTLGHELKTTFIVATHDSRMATRCDRAIELIDGKVSHSAYQWAS